MKAITEKIIINNKSSAGPIIGKKRDWKWNHWWMVQSKPDHQLFRQQYANTGQNGLFILVQLLDRISSEGFKQFLTMENGLAMTRPQKAMKI